MLVTRPLNPGKQASANCPAAAAVGDLVCISDGLSIGNIYNVAVADPALLAKMPSFAVVIAKLTATTCVIQLKEEVYGIYSGLVPGRVYFVGTDSRPSLTPPAPEVGERAYVQSIGVAVDPNVLRLEPIKSMIVRTG